MSEKIGGEISAKEAKFYETVEERIDAFKKSLLDLEEPYKEPDDLQWFKMQKEPGVHFITGFLYDLESVGFSEYNSTECMKILFDYISAVFRKSLEICNKYSSTGPVGEAIGHFGIHAFVVYAFKNPKPIPESESTVHTYAGALKNLMYLHYQMLDKALDYYTANDNTEMTEKIQNLMNQSTEKVYKEEYEAYMYQGIDPSDTEIHALEHFLKKFPHPFLSKEDKQKILQELVDKLEAAL